MLVISQVTAAWQQVGGSPLIHHHGTFARIAVPRDGNK